MPRKTKREMQLPVLHPDAAGVDIGADEIFIAVAADRDTNPVRRFPSFTPDLDAAAEWLSGCGIRTVAMESTSVYWIPFYQILEERGFEVYLVNARYVRNVPGRKTDVSDCQWIQYMHAVGLLRSSFRPPSVICAIRSLWRHRDSLIQAAANDVRHMQKALDQMNVQVHHVLSDITGVNGLRVLDSISAGQRDPTSLAALCDKRVKNSQDKIARALTGDYRPEHVFALKQSLKAYRYYQTLITEVDEHIQQHLSQVPDSPHAEVPMPKRTKKSAYAKSRREPQFDLRSELYRITGVDLTNVPGVSAMVAHTIVCEIGTDVQRFRNASAFASWLGLCPEKQISGGKVLYTHTRPVKNRIALALRMGAYSLHHADSYLGEFFRRIKRRMGKPQALMATAHKLAHIIFHLLSTRQPYDESVFRRCEEETLKRMEARLRKQAAQLGFQLTSGTLVVE